MKLLLPILLALIGAGAGIGAGLYLRPVPDATVLAVASEDGHGTPSGGQTDDHGTARPGDPVNGSAHGSDGGLPMGDGNTEFTKLNNQFVVPVLSGGRVKSMVVLSLSLETPSGKREVIYAREPRIRDMFLQVLFDHANVGGFDGAFTSGDKMRVLRGELRRAGRQLLGDDVVDVLVTDIARQDLG